MSLLKKEVLKRARKIKLVLLDVDGVLTDGRIYYGTPEGGQIELKAFHAHDGFGVSRAIILGLPVGIITGRRSKIVERRARELGIRDVFQGSDNKVPAYEKAKRRHGLEDEEIAYVGDDVLDLPLLRKVGLSAAAGTAMQDVTQAVDYVSPLAGGRGAVRDFIDLILRAQGKIP